MGKSEPGLRAKRFRYRLWLLVLSLICLAGVPPIFRGEMAATSVLVTPGGPALELTIDPDKVRDFHVAVPQGQAARLIVEEVQQTSLVTWTDAQGKVHTPRTNRSGQGALVPFTLIGIADGTDHFAVRSISKHPSHVRITASIPRPATESDAIAQAGEEALATGDVLWAKHDAKASPQVVAAYENAIAAFRQLNDRPMLRRSLEWKAVELAFTNGNPEAAIPLLEEATALPDAGDLVQQASAWKTFGFVQTTLADYPNGWRDYAKAITLFQKTGDRFNQEVMLENRGKLSRMTGDYDGALQDAHDAAAIAQEQDDRIGVLHIEDDIGEIHLLRGEMQPAFDAYEEVLGLESISPGDPMIGFAETDLANLYHRLDANTQARDMLERGNEFWKKHPYLIGQLATWIQEGKFETDSGHLTAADRIYRHGLNTASSAGMKRESVSMLLGLGNIARERHEQDKASSYLAQAGQLAASLDEQDVLAEIYIAQGDLAQSSGNFQYARDCYRQALRIAEQSYDHAGTIAALGGLAHAESSLGDEAEALAHIEPALAVIESTRDFISVDSLRTAYFSSRHSYYAMAIRILIRLDAQHPSAGYDRKALNIAERARARSLLDQIRKSGARSNQPADAALATSRAENLRDLHLAESSLAMRREHDAAQTNALKAHIADLLEREDRIESVIDRNGTGSIQGVRSLPQDFSASQDAIADLQANLDTSTALLEYWTGADASYLWVITKTSVHAHTLPSVAVLSTLASSLEEAARTPFARTPASVQMFAASLADSQARFNATGLRLGDLLLPARGIPPDVHTLLIVGDGPLLSIPFEALRVSRSRGAYLLDRYAILREPSIGVLLELLRRAATRRQMRIALFADPVFSMHDPRFAKQPNSKSADALARDPMRPAALSVVGEEDDAWENIAGYRGLRRLIYSGQEAHEIASLAGPHASFVASGFAASRERVHSLDWQNYSIAHFATHALLNPNHPELDSIVLSTLDPQGGRQPGVLWFSDISDLHMPVELVVLSACRSANGESLPGEGLVGISYAFFVAGARRVVGSLWDVDDAATATLMQEFYKVMLHGAIAPAEALRSAQRKLAGNPRWSHPYYWAAFSIAGDWRDAP